MRDGMRRRRAGLLGTGPALLVAALAAASLLPAGPAAGQTWARSYGSYYDGGYGLSEGWTIQATSDGGLVAAGNLESSFGMPIWIWVLKLDADGGVEWDRMYTHSGDA